jgi:hypothetical protein
MNKPPAKRSRTTRSRSPPDHTARPLRVPVLRQERCEASGRWYLELPLLPQDHRRRSLHRLVSAPLSRAFPHPPSFQPTSPDACATCRRIANLLTHALIVPLPPPPQGPRSVVCGRLLRFKETMGTGMEAFFERVSLHQQVIIRMKWLA